MPIALQERSTAWGKFVVEEVGLAMPIALQAHPNPWQQFVVEAAAAGLAMPIALLARPIPFGLILALASRNDLQACFFALKRLRVYFPSSGSSYSASFCPPQRLTQSVVAVVG